MTGSFTSVRFWRMVCNPVASERYQHVLPANAVVLKEVRPVFPEASRSEEFSLEIRLEHQSEVILENLWFGPTRPHYEFPDDFVVQGHHVGDTMEMVVYPNEVPSNDCFVMELEYNVLDEPRVGKLDGGRIDDAVREFMEHTWDRVMEADEHRILSILEDMDTE